MYKAKLHKSYQKKTILLLSFHNRIGNMVYRNQYLITSPHQIIFDKSIQTAI